jgi:hypothetical protein
MMSRRTSVFASLALLVLALASGAHQAAAATSGSGTLSSGQADDLARFVCAAEGSDYAEEVVIEGGPGDTQQQPLIVRARSSSAGIASEYAYVERVLGVPTVDWYVVTQALVADDAGPLDVLVVWDVTGIPPAQPSEILQTLSELYEVPSGAIRAFYFNIAEFIGREPHGPGHCIPLR